MYLRYLRLFIASRNLMVNLINNKFANTKQDRQFTYKRNILVRLCNYC